MNISEFDLRALGRGEKQTIPLDVTTLPDGSPLRLHALVATGRADGPTVVVLAGIHGDEYEGITAIPEIFRRLDPALLRGTFVALPVCNVPAYVAASRTSPVDGLNMARVFPGDPNGAVTQRIAYWLGECIMRHADLIVDLHSAGLFYNIPMLCGYYLPDARSRAVAMQFGADVVWGHPDMALGRTMSFAVEHGIPGVYTEAPGGGRVRPEDLATMVTGVFNSLKVIGMLDGAPDARPPTHRLVGAGDLDHIIAASHGGLFFARVHLLDDVRAGDVLGEVRDTLGQMLEEIRSPADGLVITMRGLLRVNAGDGLFALARRE